MSGWMKKVMGVVNNKSIVFLGDRDTFNKQNLKLVMDNFEAENPDYLYLLRDIVKESDNFKTILKENDMK